MSPNRAVTVSTYGVKSLPSVAENLTSPFQGDSRNLWSIPISEETGTVEGEPQRLTAGAGDDVQPSMADDGRIVFANQSVKTDLWSVPVDANRGQVTGEIERLTNDAAFDTLPFVSADGSKVVFISNRAGNNRLGERFGKRQRHSANGDA